MDDAGKVATWGEPDSTRDSGVVRVETRLVHAAAANGPQPSPKKEDHDT
jgi:hypothetical protein